jgi:hypothetical protein
MARFIMCRKCEKLHSVSEQWPRECSEARPHYSKRTVFLSDTREPVQSMVDGKYYDSRSALREHYKVSGVECVGDAPMNIHEEAKGSPIMPDVEKSIAMLENGYRPEVNTMEWQ